jgi:hypothetical protein
VADPFFLEDALDAQHLLHLVADGELILELQGQVLTQVHVAALLVLDHLRPEGVALLRVRLQRKQAFSLDHPGSVSRGGGLIKLKLAIPSI